jgi:hypothetical protein
MPTPEELLAQVRTTIAASTQARYRESDRQRFDQFMPIAVEFMGLVYLQYIVNSQNANPPALPPPEYTTDGERDLVKVAVEVFREWPSTRRFDYSKVRPRPIVILPNTNDRYNALANRAQQAGYSSVETWLVALAGE